MSRVDSVYNIFRTGLKEYLVKEGKFVTNEELDALVTTQLETAIVELEDDMCFNLTTHRSVIKTSIEDMKKEREIPAILLFDAHVDHSKMELVSKYTFRLIEYSDVVYLEHRLVYNGEADTAVVLINGVVEAFKIEEFRPMLCLERYNVVVWENDAYEVSGYGDGFDSDEFDEKKFLVKSRLDVKRRVTEYYRSFDMMEIKSLFDGKTLDFKLFTKEYDSTQKVPKCIFDTSLVFVDDEGDRVYDALDDDIDLELPF